MSVVLARQYVIPVAAIAALFAACFGGALCLDRVIAFRDAGNYYYPLFEWQCEQWSQGRIPLWNPLDGTGSPSFAETSSSVLYPGKLVFVLPLSFQLRYTLYVCGHVLLAAVAALWVARRLGYSVEAAALCAISYGFAGAVLFQVHNVVFLVGAAWLPFAVFATERMITTRARGAAVALGAVLALIVLGGDPQTAYHAGLLAVLFALFQSRPGQATRGARKLGLLTIAAVTALSLSAVQVLPAIEWAVQSDRAVYDEPRSLFEALHRADSVASLPKNIMALTESPRAGSHYAKSFDFSLAPWQLAELFWPNCFGNFFPINARWTSALPAASRVWSPSIYMGLLPALLCINGLCWRTGSARRRWLSWSLLLFGLAALGQYGVGWLVHEFRVGLLGAAQDDVWVARPMGGLYWWMTILLPGYAYFRYPAKLLVVASMLASLLAAGAWDDLFATRARRIRLSLIVMAVVSVTAGAIFLILRTTWAVWVQTAPVDPLFGPLDAVTASRWTIIALVHTTVVSLLLLLVIRYGSIGHRGRLMTLVVTAVDLGLANAALVGTVPSAVLERSAGSEDRAFNTQGWRAVRGTVEPPTSWSRASDPNRLAHVVRWERTSLHPKHHLAAKLPLLESRSSLTSSDVRAVARLRQATSDDADLYDFYSAKFQIESDSVDPMQVRIKANERSMLMPRTWMVRRWIEQPTPPRRLSRHDLDQLTRDVFFEQGRLRDLTRTAVVEDAADRPSIDKERAADAPAPQSRVLSSEPNRLEIAVDCSTDALLIVNDLYCAGWQAWIHQQAGEETKARIFRTNRTMRGVFVPAGQHRVVMRYRPVSFYAGAAISGLAWLVIGLGKIVQLRQVPRRLSRQEERYDQIKARSGPGSSGSKG